MLIPFYADAVVKPSGTGLRIHTAVIIQHRVQ
jgi:hypothetical protein